MTVTTNARHVTVAVPVGRGARRRAAARCAAEGRPTLTFSLVGGSSQPGPPARPGSEAAVEIVISQNYLRFALWPF